jgi:urease accessory protein UreF
MIDGQVELVAELPEEITGEVRELLECIGVAEALPGINTLHHSESQKPVIDLLSLQGFLQHYVDETLTRIELPAVVSAWQHANAGKFRELMDLDRTLCSDAGLRPFRAASCAVGRRQLSKLRALKDHRLLQRYLSAVERGDAAGWHALVYGIFLSIYSVPLRQGILHLAHNTLGGLTFKAAAGCGLRLTDCQAAVQQIAEQLPTIVNTAMDRIGTESENNLFLSR